MLRRENSSESVFNRAVHNKKLEFLSKYFDASWLVTPLCIMFLDGNLVCRSTKLAQEILFIWTPPECFLNLG